MAQIDSELICNISICDGGVTVQCFLNPKFVPQMDLPEKRSNEALGDKLIHIKRETILSEILNKATECALSFIKT